MSWTSELLPEIFY